MIAPRQRISGWCREAMTVDNTLASRARRIIVRNRVPLHSRRAIYSYILRLLADFCWAILILPASYILATLAARRLARHPPNRRVS